MRSGCTIDGVRYKGMFVRVEGGGGKGREGRNAWLTIECTEGKVRWCLPSMLFGLCMVCGSCCWRFRCVSTDIPDWCRAVNGCPALMLIFFFSLFPFLFLSSAPLAHILHFD